MVENELGQWGQLAHTVGRGSLCATLPPRENFFPRWIDPHRRAQIRIEDGPCWWGSGWPFVRLIGRCGLLATRLFRSPIGCGAASFLRGGSTTCRMGGAAGLVE